jgi:uncharacterized membrane protein YdbT with pleckstrin-like domain
MDEETVLLSMHPSRFAYLASYVAGVFLFFVFFIINNVIQTGLPWIPWAGPPLGALFILVTDIVRGSETFIVSGDGVARQFELFSSSKTFIEYRDIEEVNIKQGIFQRIFGIGDIVIESAAEDAAGVTFHDVSNPGDAEGLIRRKMDEAGKGSKIDAGA